MAGSNTAPNPYIDPAHKSVSVQRIGRRGGDRPVLNALPSVPANRPAEVRALYPITDPTKAGDLPPDVVANMAEDLRKEQEELARLGLAPSNPFMAPLPVEYETLGEEAPLPNGLLEDATPVPEPEKELQTVTAEEVGSVEEVLGDELTDEAGNAVDA